MFGPIWSRIYAWATGISFSSFNSTFNVTFDTTDFPKEISVVRNNIDLLKVKNARFPSLKVFDVFRGHTDLSFGKLCFSGDDSFELSALMSRNECGCFNNVEEFDINNQYYKTIDGIIYSNDGKTLIACPGKKGGTIKVAEGTKYVLRCAFYNSHASEIIFPDSLIELGPESIKACDNLQHIDFGKGIKRIGGADMPTISYCENLAEFDIPEQVEANRCVKPSIIIGIIITTAAINEGRQNQNSKMLEIIPASSPVHLAHIGN